MARTKQTPRQGIGQHQMPRAMFAAPNYDATPALLDHQLQQPLQTTVENAPEAENPELPGHPDINVHQLMPGVCLQHSILPKRMSMPGWLEPMQCHKVITSLQIHRRSLSGGLEPEHFEKFIFIRNPQLSYYDTCPSYVLSEKWLRTLKQIYDLRQMQHILFNVPAKTI